MGKIKDLGVSGVVMKDGDPTVILKSTLAKRSLSVVKTFFLHFQSFLLFPDGMAQLSLYTHKGGLNPIHFMSQTARREMMLE